MTLRIFSIACIVGALPLAACDDSDMPQASVTSEGNDWPAVKHYEVDAVEVSLCLLNEKGDTTSTFSYGEDITFDVMLRNNGRYNYSFADNERTLFGTDAFRVFSWEGTDWGLSWEYSDMVAFPMSLQPEQEVVYRCKWYNKPHSVEVFYPFVTKEDCAALPTGNYYTQFELCIGNRSVLTVDSLRTLFDGVKTGDVSVDAYINATQQTTPAEVIRCRKDFMVI